LQEALLLTGPLTARHGVTLEAEAGGQLPHPAINGVALRQILLSILNSAILFGPGGRVQVTTTEAEAEVTIHIQSFRADAPGAPSPESFEASLAMARQLARVSGGRLSAQADKKALRIGLVLPVLESVPVLVVEDSADSILLLQRLLSYTRFRLFSAHRLEQALEVAGEVGARVILLDLMMPRTDGWTVLQALRSHPATAKLPVVICSILPLEELSLSLGADAFLHKPVSRTDLLATLDRLAALAPESR